MSGDGRKIGVVVITSPVLTGRIKLGPIIARGVTLWKTSPGVVDRMNAEHRERTTVVTKEERSSCSGGTGRSSRQQSARLPMTILDRAAPVSLNANAPLTCQFIVEDHAVRHSYHHLARIRAALEQKNVVALSA